MYFASTSGSHEVQRKTVHVSSSIRFSEYLGKTNGVGVPDLLAATFCDFAMARRAKVDCKAEAPKPLNPNQLLKPRIDLQSTTAESQIP